MTRGMGRGITQRDMNLARDIDKKNHENLLED